MKDNKRKIIKLVLLIIPIILIVILFCISKKDTSIDNNKSKISEKDATAIVIGKLGNGYENIYEIKTRSDKDNYIYEIVRKSTNTAYKTYYVNKNTGEVEEFLSKEKSVESSYIRMK